MSKLLDHRGRPMNLPDAEVDREDAWGNWATGIGTGQDKTRAASYLPVWRVLDQELTSLMNGSDIARKIVSARPEEMFRRGYDIDAKALPTKKSKPGEEGEAKAPVSETEKDDILEYATEYLDLNNNLLAGKRWGRLYGGALLLMGIDDGRMPWEPLDENNIRDFYALSLVDRRYAYVQSQYAAMGASSQYGHAQVYLISNAVAGYGWDAYGATSIKTKSRQQLLQQGAQVALVHESRVIRFDGNDADIVTRQNLAGWTWSVLQVVYDAMRQFEGSFDSAAYLLSDASQGVFKLQGLFKAISSGNRAALAMRMQMLELSRSVMHGVALDAGSKDGLPTESFERVPTPFAGIPDLLDKMMLRMASAADMPATKLWGRAPAGLNATGDADIRGWYDTIESEAKNDLAPIIKRVFKLLCLAKKGPLRGRKVKWDVKFHPLWSPTDGEVATAKLTNAQADVAYITAGVVKPEEVAVDLTEVYPRLDLKAREEALEGGLLFDPYENEPAPEASALQTQTGEPQSPKAPVPLMGTSGSQVTAGNLPAVAAAEAASSGQAGRQPGAPEREAAQKTPMQRGADNEAKQAAAAPEGGKGKPSAKNEAPGEAGPTHAPPPEGEKGGKPTEAAPGTEPTKAQAKDKERDKPPTKPAQKDERADGVSAEPSPSVYALDASICLVWDAAGRLLCVSRPEGELALPGGGVDPGETPAHAAMRELREELGVTVSALRSHGTVVSPTDARTVHVYTAGRWAGVPRAKEADTRFAWLTPGELLEQAVLFRDTLEELLERGALTKPVAPGGAAPGQPRSGSNVAGAVAPTQDRDPDAARDRYPAATGEDTSKAAKLADRLTTSASTGEEHREAGKIHSIAAAFHRECESRYEAQHDDVAAAAHHAEAERHEGAAADHAAKAQAGGAAQVVDAHDPASPREHGKWTHAAATKASQSASAATAGATDAEGHTKAVKAHALASQAHRYMAMRQQELGNTKAAGKHHAKAMAHDQSATEHQSQAHGGSEGAGPKAGSRQDYSAEQSRDERGRFGEGGSSASMTGGATRAKGAPAPSKGVAKAAHEPEATGAAPPMEEPDALAPHELSRDDFRVFEAEEGSAFTPQEVVTGLRHEGVSSWLKDPEHKPNLRIERIAPGSRGEYEIDAKCPNGEIRIDKKADDVEEAKKGLPNGQTWSVSYQSAADGRQAATQSCFIHELGHHIHLYDRMEYADGRKVSTPERPSPEAIAHQAYVDRGMRSTSIRDGKVEGWDKRGLVIKDFKNPAVSVYAAANHLEYFAENFAAYMRDPEGLKSFDPIGHKMVVDVLTMRGIKP